MRKMALLPILILAVGFSAGCASVLIKETRDFKTTTLFDRPCVKTEQEGNISQLVQI